MATVPRASIIIRTRNEEARLPLVLEALFDQSENSFEVILVDSGSTDTTLDIARGWPVRIVHMPHSAFTFGRALNLGASLARGQFLVNLSGHAVPVDNHWLERLLEPFTDPEVAAVGGAYVPWYDADPFDKRAAGKSKAAAQPLAIPPRRSGLFGNDNAALRRSLWQTLPFEEAAGGGEDFLWLQQLLARGWKAIQQPAAIVRHSHLESPIEIFDRYLRGAYSLEKVMPAALRHRASVLVADALPGAIFDYQYCNRTGQSEWRGYAIKRRLARAAGRLLGARRWLVQALMSCDKALAKPTLRLTQLAGLSEHPLQPSQYELDIGTDLSVPGLALALEEAQQVLKPGGLFFITIPNWDTHWKLTRRRLGLFAYQDEDHKREYSLAQVKVLLAEAEFELVSEPVTITADLPGSDFICLLGSLWPRLFRLWGGFRKRLALRFPQETTGWRIIARKKEQSA